MKATTPPATTTLRIERVTVKTNIRAGQLNKELTIKCSMHNDCTGMTGG